MRVLGVDVGGTNVRLAQVAPSGEILEQHREQWDLAAHGASESEILDALCRVIRPHLRGVHAVGIGFPGFFHAHSGVLALSPNLPSLRDLPLAEEVERRLSVQVEAQNDALCAALGEFHFGAARGCEHLLHITLGTGVGGGLILHHRPFFGADGMACEYGHLRIDEQGDPCGCGQRGCLETFASATAIRRRYARASGEDCPAAEVYRRACAGERDALRCFQDAGEALGRAIAETVKLLDLRDVSLSGGVSQAWDLLLVPLQATMEAALLPPQQGQVRILRSVLQDRGGVLGAASLALGLV